MLRQSVVHAAINAEHLRVAQVFTDGYTNRRMRHAAYQQFVAHAVRPTGLGARVVVPVFVVAAIRHCWPSVDGRYTGFKKATFAGYKELQFTLDGGRELFNDSDDADN